MSFKFTLTKDQKITKIISKLIKSGTALVSKKWEKVKDEAKSERMLETALHNEAVHILHNRILNKIAKTNKKRGNHNYMQAKHKKARHKAFRIGIEMVKNLKHSKWVEAHKAQIKDKKQTRKVELAHRLNTTPRMELSRYERQVLKKKRAQRVGII